MNTKSIASVLALGAVLLAVSCSSTYADYCDKEIECEGGNDADRDACIATGRATENIASDYDCSDAFDSWFECAESGATCTNGKITSTGCNEKLAALSACLTAASGKRSIVSSSSSSSGDGG